MAPRLERPNSEIYGHMSSRSKDENVHVALRSARWTPSMMSFGNMLPVNGTSNYDCASRGWKGSLTAGCF